MKYGRWVIIWELGKGGQGITHLAEDNIVFYSILDTITKAVQSLPGIHSSGEYQSGARGLADSVREYSSAVDGKGVAALKVLYESVRNDSKALARLKQEIEVLKKNPHPHILGILDSSPSEGGSPPHFSPSELLQTILPATSPGFWSPCKRFVHLWMRLRASIE